MYRTQLTVLSSLKSGKASLKFRISLIAMNDHGTQRGQVTVTATSGRANKSEVANKD